MLKITAEEVNFLIHQYLEETGYKHTAFTFQHESGMDSSALKNPNIAPSMLLMYLEKALLMLQMETHLDKDDEVILCNAPFTLLNPHVCGYIRAPVDKVHEDLTKRPPQNQIPVSMSMHIGPPDSLPRVTIPPQVQSSMPITTQSMHPQGGIQINVQSGMRPAEVDKMQIDTPKPKEEAQKVPAQPVLSVLQGVHAVPQKESGDSMLEEEKKPGKSAVISKPSINLSALSNIKAVRILEGHQEMVYNVAWHPTKKILASGGGDSTARLWQIPDFPEKLGTSADTIHKNPTQIQILPHINPEANISRIDVTSLNWSAKKGLLVTGGSDGIARVWNEAGIFLIIL